MDFNIGLYRESPNYGPQEKSGREDIL